MLGYQVCTTAWLIKKKKTGQRERMGLSLQEVWEFSQERAVRRDEAMLMAKAPLQWSADEGTWSAEKGCQDLPSSETLMASSGSWGAEE